MTTGVQNSPESLQAYLEELGFPLVDRGKFWHTKAIYRDGDNPSAIQIYKDSGVWRDFVENTEPQPLFKLVERVTGQSVDRQTIDGIKDAQPKSEPKIKENKLYPSSILTRLLPHYKFYLERGIPEAVLRVYGGGLATSGDMYQRYTFPIYNDEGAIFGFAGRDMLERPEGTTRPKWKIIGPKREFKYPFNLPHEGKTPFKKHILDAEDVFIVESIGDSMSLSAAGLKNHLVTFGVGISPAILSCLVSSNCKNIYICFNNDEVTEDEEAAGKKNVGMVRARKASQVIEKYCDSHNIEVCTLPKNDFGDMNVKEIRDFCDTLKR